MKLRCKKTVEMRDESGCRTGEISFIEGREYDAEENDSGGTRLITATNEQKQQHILMFGDDDGFIGKHFEKVEP